MCNAVYSQAQLAALAGEVKKRLSPKRFAHTQGVADMIERLAALYCPALSGELCAAALLHDMTKELDDAAQAALLRSAGVTLRPDEAASPKIWHAITAPLVIKAEFAPFATPTVLSAVRWHTTAREGLTLPEALLYLADGIEEGRTYPLAVTLRHALLDGIPAEQDGRLCRLAHVVHQMLQATVDFNRGSTLCRDTLDALKFTENETCFFERNEI